MEMITIYKFFFPCSFKKKLLQWGIPILYTLLPNYIAGGMVYIIEYSIQLMSDWLNMIL